MFTDKSGFSAVFIFTIFTGCFAIAQQQNSNIPGSFVSSGISRELIPSEAEVNMAENARMKCDTIEGAKQVTQTVFRNYQGNLYASAKFTCIKGALDKRKCWYPDDSNPDCFPHHD